MSTWLNDWLEIDENLNLSISEVQTSKYKRLIVEAKWNLTSQDVASIQLNMRLKDANIRCMWKPHLAPEEDMVIGDQVFRSPVMIFEKEDKLFALVPDIDFIETGRVVPHFMDYVEPERTLFYGLGHYVKTKHVYFKRIEESFRVEQGETLFRFHLVEWDEFKESRNFLPVTEYLWETFAEKRMLQAETSVKDIEPYAKHTYSWAFHNWEQIVWNEFELGQEKVGGCVFIVRGAQSPGNGQEDNWREKKSLWNQAWFSSLRSAYGYHLWGKQWNNADMVRRAELAKNFALAAPQKNGLFPSVYWADADNQWEAGNWGHSDRRPEHHDDYAHLLDMSWTCIWMLKWYEDIEEDTRLLEYTRNYIKRLLTLQATDGSFPAWVHPETGDVSPFLNDSPETSIHVWLLAKFYQLTGEGHYLLAGINGMKFVLNGVLPEGRWEDFETYWSCSRAWEEKQYGVKDKRSGLYNQCNFSIYWTAEALKELYLATKDETFLREGEKVLAELSLYQAIWEPEFLHLPVLGGFGVMTSDDEWNDSRQSLFALTYQDYYKITNKEEYKYRSFWAMKASFYMMYCPENPTVKEIYEKTYPHFGEKDYGFEMENAHHGENSEKHAGDFTIFDWGNGSASASLAELLLKK